MPCYFCIMSTEQHPVVDLCVLDAKTDASAVAGARNAAEQSGGVDRLEVYHGERLVASLRIASQELGVAA